ncbi:uncharacterized protein KY384_006642 [Bacidia gigantensis]|uniref:uncharacterized protein n=1 Tax=Bacidia gigantensis TaxID=2732470 RepID=UPI001D0390C5|nr:uncharacterized protein KY384_006642 [Bacidia gigantensis]KAG8528953.1 hypothetical protein KY384_006642 [Bacidia gigantensis]
MPYSYERYETRRRQGYGASSGRTAWGHWIPLAVTVTIATAGVVAWIWNERKDDDDDHDYPPPPQGDRPPDGYGPPPGTGYGASGPQGPPGGFGPQSGYSGPPPSNLDNIPPGQTPYGPDPEQREIGDDGIVSRVSGALRRTPSPQQIFDGASKRVVAGVAAAGAAVGGALASITEEEKGGYEDHTRWSEEADSQNDSSRKGPELRDTESATIISQTQTGSKSSKKKKKKKTVVIVVSAETDHQYEEDAGYHQEHASILSHLPDHVDQDTRVFVLIYDPTLKEHPLASSEQQTQSMSSSYSNIGHEDAQSRGEVSPAQSTPVRSKMFETLYGQAKVIVEKETMIMPFTTPTAFVQMVRQLEPETVYLQSSLAGSHGEQLDIMKNWVGQIVLVVGDESGHAWFQSFEIYAMIGSMTNVVYLGGLVDSEDERGTDDAQTRWWLQDSRIGLGKGIEVVEGLRIGEDWGRRIKGHD